MASTGILALCLFAADPRSEPLRDTAEIVELNHFYDSNGRLVFDQFIFWEWHEEAGEFHVMAWVFLKSPAQIPARNWPSGGYLSTWLDGDRFRQVWARSFCETWTQFDPEVENHKRVPPDRRRGLTGERPIPSKTRPAPPPKP